MPVYQRKVAHNWDWLTLCRREPGKAVWKCCQSWIWKINFTSRQKLIKEIGKTLQRDQHAQKHSSVQFSHSVVSDSWWPHGLQHTRPPCPSPTPRVYPNSCPLSQYCHPTISSSVILFSSHLQSFPASESFQISQLFASGGQSIGVSASTSVIPMNTQDWCPFGWTGWISLQSKGLSKVFSNTTVQKHQFFGSQLSSQSKSHIHTRLLEKP